MRYWDRLDSDRTPFGPREPYPRVHFRINSLKQKLRKAPSFAGLISENVRKLQKQLPLSPGVSIGADSGLLEKVKGTHLVDPVNVICMGVGIQNGIDSPDLRSKGLLS
jgi:hypothetical protein